MPVKPQPNTGQMLVKPPVKHGQTLVKHATGDERLADSDDVDKLCVRLEAEALAALGDQLCVMGISRAEQKAIVAKALQVRRY